MTKRNVLEIVIKAFGIYCLIQFTRSTPAVASAITLDQPGFVSNRLLYASVMCFNPLLHLTLSYFFLRKSEKVMRLFGSISAESSLPITDSNEYQPIYAKLSFWITTIGLYYFVSSISVVVSRLGTITINLREGAYLVHDPILPQAFIFIISIIFIFRSEKVANYIKRK